MTSVIKKIWDQSSCTKLCDMIFHFYTAWAATNVLWICFQKNDISHGGQVSISPCDDERVIRTLIPNNV